MDSEQKSTEAIRLLLTEEFVEDLDFYQDDEVEFIIQILYQSLNCPSFQLIWEL